MLVEFEVVEWVVVGERGGVELVVERGAHV